MAARSALSRLAPALSNASRAAPSFGTRRALQAARGYATAESEHFVCYIIHITVRAIL